VLDVASRRGYREISLNRHRPSGKCNAGFIELTPSLRDGNGITWSGGEGLSEIGSQLTMDTHRKD